MRMNLEFLVDAVLVAESTKGQRKPINNLEGNNKSVRYCLIDPSNVVDGLRLKPAYEPYCLQEWRIK